MITIRRGTVTRVEVRGDVLTLSVDVGGRVREAIAYSSLVAAIEEGDTVVLNTTAVDRALGTGGLDLVIAVEGKERDGGPGDGMKMRYSPLQASVDPVEERHRDAVDALDDLDRMPVVVAGLHSALAPVLIGARSVAPSARIAYVMTDAAALHIGFSTTVRALRGAALLDVTLTAGQSLGGDHEAVTVHGALAAARAVEGADITVVSMGPGNLGTGSRWGFALLETAGLIDAVDALGGRPIVVPRVSFADARPRHYGVSHHTVTALRVARARATVALPTLDLERRALVLDRLAPVADRHDLVEVDLGLAERSLANAPVTLSSMGRAFVEDPDYFRAGAAAGVLAARTLTSTR